MKLNEIAPVGNNRFLTDIQEIENWITNHDCILSDSAFDIEEDGTVNVVGNVSLGNYDKPALEVKFGLVTGTFDLSNSEIEDLSGMPRRCNRVYLTGCKKLHSLKGITAEIRTSISITECDNITSFEGIHQHIRKLGFLNSNETGGLVFETKNIKSGGMGFLLIEGKWDLNSTFISSANALNREPFLIIERYLGKPNQIYECQAELIEYGFEEFAKL